ncbi:MAG: tryptophan-rich sensory protein [Patescibacteria group bacterium]
MKQKFQDKFFVTKVIAAVTYVIMIAVNILANLMPINGQTTAQISDSYMNLFAPAGFTFAIWGAIYVALGVYVVSQFILPQQSGRTKHIIESINRFFIISSIANTIWIFAWHYLAIGFTVILTVTMLYTLIKIADLINIAGLNGREKLLLKVPFGLYFGWVTVATIANITVYLVSIGWNGWGISQEIWMIIVLFVGLVISILRTHKDKNIAYGLVPVWAYFGILMRHVSKDGFGGMYPNIVMFLGFCIAVLIITNIYQAVKKEYI